MAAARVGAIGAVSQTGGSGGAAVFGQTPTAGNKLILTAVANRPAAGSLTLSISGGNQTWTPIETQLYQANSAAGATMARWWADATAGATVPTVALTGNSGTVRIEVEEISGLASGAPDSSGTMVGLAGASGTLTAAAQTTTNATDFVHASAAVYSTTVPTLTPTAPLVAFSAQSGNANEALISTYGYTTSSSGSQGPWSVAYSGAGGLPSGLLAVATWKLSGGGGGATTAPSPVITKTGSGSSKTAGTTVVSTLTSTSYAVGDILVVGLSMDPASGTVSFAKTAGTAAIGAFTLQLDLSNANARSVMAYAKVTTAGTITSVTATHPSVTARAVGTFNVTGADATVPIFTSNSSSSTGAGTATLTVTGTKNANSALLVWSTGEGVGGATTTGQTTVPTQTGNTWTKQFADTTTTGTTGAGGASNMSFASAAWQTNSLTNNLITYVNNQPSGVAGGSLAVLFVATAPPAAPTTLTLTVNGAYEIDTSWSTVTGATGYLLEYSLNGSTGWTTIYSGTATSFNHTGLTASTTYYYRISASGATGTSLYTTNNASTTAPPFILPFSDSFTGTDNSAVSSVWDQSNIPTNDSLFIKSNAARFQSVDPAITDGFATGPIGSTVVTGDQGVLYRARSNGDTRAGILTCLVASATNVFPPDCYYLSSGFDHSPSSGASSSWGITKLVSFSSTNLTSISGQPALLADTYYWIRFEKIGSTLQAKYWVDGSSEPSTWLLTTTDSTLTTGGLTLNVSLPNTALVPRSVDIDDLTYYVPGAAPPTSSADVPGWTWFRI